MRSFIRLYSILIIGTMQYTQLPLYVTETSGTYVAANDPPQQNAHTHERTPKRTGK